MTTFNQAVKTYVQSDAEFRTLYGYIRTALTNFGWVQTSDTGQVNPSTMTYPGSNNLDAGYECWRMNDSLQATRPFGMKIRPGRGTANGVMRIAVSFSMSNFTGSGTFEGTETTTHNQETCQAPSTRAIGDTTQFNIWASGDTNRFVFAFFPDTLAAGFGTMLGIERTHNSDGSDNGNGITGYSAWFKQNINNWYGLQKPWADNGTNAFRTNNSAAGFWTFPGAAGSSFGNTPRQWDDGLSTLYNGNVFAFPIFPAWPGWKYPGLNQLVYAYNDFPIDQTNFDVTILGATHTYKPLGFGSGGAPNGNLSNGCIAIRYE